MDGGYVIKRLGSLKRRFPSGAEIAGLAGDLVSSVSLGSLYRAFFYHADPYREAQRRPLTGERIAFGDSAVAKQTDKLLREVELAEDFAVRRGEVVYRGWRLHPTPLRRLQVEPGGTVTADDFVPDFVQKGVDMRIGLDIAALALKRLVDTVVLVTGDADMVPAMRFARREGLRVGLCPLGFEGIRPELRAHADFLIHWPPKSESPNDTKVRPL